MSSSNENFPRVILFVWGRGAGSLAVIKPDLSRNLVEPAAAVNYPASRNLAGKLAKPAENYAKIRLRGLPITGCAHHESGCTNLTNRSLIAWLTFYVGR